MTAILQLNQLSLTYGKQPVVTELSLSVDAGDWLAILGRSGCGKSTLLKAIAKLNHGAIQHGQIHCHAKTAYMAQQDALLPWLSVVQNVQLASRLQHNANSKTLAQAHKLLHNVGLGEHAHKPPYELSGGQRQRVALARTLMQDAEIILMDEPFSAVDAITRLDLQQLAAELLVDKSVILITHDPQEAIRLADSIYIMQNGGLSQPYKPEKPRPRFIAEQSQLLLQQQLLEVLSQ